MVVCKLSKYRTINYNQKSIVNEKWKVFCAILALLYTGDVIAMKDSLSRSSSSSSLSSSSTTFLDEESASSRIKLSNEKTAAHLEKRRVGKTTQAIDISH